MGRKGITWSLIGLLASVLLALNDFVLAGILQSLMSISGVESDSQSELFSELNLGILEISVGIVIVGLVKGIFVFLVNLSSNITKENVNLRLRKLTLFDFLMNKEEKLASTIHTEIGELFPKASMFIFCSVNTIGALLQFGVLVLLMASMAFTETVFALASLFALGITYRAFNRRIVGTAEKVPIAQAELLEQVDCAAKNKTFIHICQTQGREYLNCEKRVDDYYFNSVYSSIFASIAPQLPVVVGMSLVAAIIYGSQQYVSTPVSVLIAFLFLFVRLIQQVSVVVSSVASCLRFLPHFRESCSLYDRVTKEYGDRAFSFKVTGGFSPKSLARNNTPVIDVQGIAYGWNSSKQLFDDFSLKVPAGGVLGILGPSGSGKSTLLRLLLGLSLPTKGKVLIDGQYANDFLEKRYDSIGYAGPDPFLFPGTVRDNIVYGLNYNPTDNEIWEALASSALKETLEKIDRGLGYELGPNGVGLSTGQKQRLSIARAFLRKPKLLILDEATANLDLDTERTIMDYIENRMSDTTVVIVTHRPAVAAKCKQRVDLENLGALAY